jgi:antitoxin HicB
MTEMTTAPGTNESLEELLARQYTVHVIADEEGGYVIVYPDLPGCMSQVDSVDEIPGVAEEIRILWLETAHQLGHPVSPPSYPEEYSGKFNLRLPKSLHRELAESAKAEGVSLNQYVTMLLSRGNAQARIESLLGERPETRKAS